MPKPQEIFENEEATKLLDYFVAYKKLISKIDYVKCAALNGEISITENHPQLTKQEPFNPINENQPTIDLQLTQHAANIK